MLESRPASSWVSTRVRNDGGAGLTSRRQGDTTRVVRCHASSGDLGKVRTVPINAGGLARAWALQPLTAASMYHFPRRGPAGGKPRAEKSGQWLARRTPERRCGRRRRAVRIPCGGESAACSQCGAVDGRCSDAGRWSCSEERDRMTSRRHPAAREAPVWGLVGAD